MANPLDNAKKRLASLKAEIADVERFIAMYEAFSDETEVDRGDPTSLSIHAGSEETFHGDGLRKPVDNLPDVRRRRGPRPDEIAQMVLRIIQEHGAPMTRGQLVEALERRDVELPAADKARYLGTIIWRHKSIFINIEGQGYWLRGERMSSPQPVIEPEPEADLSNLFGN